MMRIEFRRNVEQGFKLRHLAQIHCVFALPLRFELLAEVLNGPNPIKIRQQAVKSQARFFERVSRTKIERVIRNGRRDDPPRIHPGLRGDAANQGDDKNYNRFHKNSHIAKRMECGGSDAALGSPLQYA